MALSEVSSYLLTKGLGQLPKPSWWLNGLLKPITEGGFAAVDQSVAYALMFEMQVRVVQCGASAGPALRRGWRTAGSGCTMMLRAQTPSGLIPPHPAHTDLVCLGRRCCRVFRAHAPHKHC
jgi:hypothetical protein